MICLTLTVGGFRLENKSKSKTDSIIQESRSYKSRFLFNPPDFFWALESNRSGSLLVRLYMADNPDTSSVLAKPLKLNVLDIETQKWEKVSFGNSEDIHF